MSDHDAPSVAPMRKRRRQPSAAERWAARTRDMRILDALKRGAPMAAIADQEGLTLRRIRTIVNALLAENLGLEPASGFAQAQMRRLDAALRAALRALGHGEASSVERLLRVVREFERYSEIAEPSATERSPRRARENQKAETLGEPKD